LLNRLLARTRLRQLQLLVLIADLGSIQRAAEVVGQTQSSATKALSELERMVGLPLFERHARGVRPTLICRDLLPLLRNMLGSLNGCAEMLAAAAEGVQGILSVGAITGALSGFLGRELPPFLQQHPQLRVEVVEDSHHALLAGLAARTLDMVLVRAPAAAISGTRLCRCCGTKWLWWQPPPIRCIENVTCTQASCLSSNGFWHHYPRRCMKLSSVCSSLANTSQSARLSSRDLCPCF
jgi:DNA-binding transcriptional LysR family regulator